MCSVKMSISPWVWHEDSPGRGILRGQTHTHHWDQPSAGAAVLVQDNWHHLFSPHVIQIPKKTRNY